MKNGTLSYDDSAENDLANVSIARALSEEDTGWVIRAMVGAIRPNRDLPFFILAHVLAILAIYRRGDDRRTLLDDLLNPTLSAPIQFKRLFERAPPDVLVTERGLALAWFTEPVGWRAARRALALCEMLLTADDCVRFSEVSSLVDRIRTDPTHGAVIEVGRALGRLVHAWRQDHIPLARLERQLRKVAKFMTGRGSSFSRGPSDQDLLDYYAAEINSGERPMFRSVVESFLSIQRALDQQLGREALLSASSLDTLLPSEEAQIELMSELAGEPQERSVTAINTIPNTPRLLKQVEKDRLRACLSLEPFTMTLPLTVLRVTSFGLVQWGILNRLRRGSGGPPIEQRVECADAERYVDLISATQDLEVRLATLLKIAFGLRSTAKSLEGRVDNDRAEALAAEGLAAMKRIRRAGFDDENPVLRDAFAGAEDALIGLHAAMRQHNAANAALAARSSLTEIFAEDQTFFAANFRRTYLTTPGENPNESIRSGYIEPGADSR